jgi:uncharacterized protein
MQSRVPVQQTIDNVTSWNYLDESWSGTGGNVIAAKGGRTKVYGELSLQPFEMIDPAAWRVKDRLELLDEIGIYAQVLYPNGIGFSSNHIFAIEDLVDRAAILQIYNDYLVEVQDESKGRLFPQAMLPIWDMDLTAREMTRMLDKGITGFTLSDKPELMGLPELVEPYFEPMWDIFNESGAVANFHIGAGRRREDSIASQNQAGFRTGSASNAPAGTGGQPANLAWQSLPRQRTLPVICAQIMMSNLRIIANLCMSDLFDRFPLVKIVSAESGIGWVPFLLETLEFQSSEMLTEPDALQYAKRRPTEYFHDHISVMFWFERSGPEKLIETIGVNNVLFESDIPHPTCFYPGLREHLLDVLKDVDPAVCRRVLQDNAAELYGVTVS